ncbi:unnamed protein product [Ascophyllum nodosum]
MVMAMVIVAKGLSTPIAEMPSSLVENIQERLISVGHPPPAFTTSVRGHLRPPCVFFAALGFRCKSSGKCVPWPVAV